MSLSPDAAGARVRSRSAAPARPGKTNRQLREEAVDRMIDAAVALVAAKGAARLSLVDVGRVAGYSHTLPNYYFESKYELLRFAYARSVGAFRRRSGAWRRGHAGRQARASADLFETIRAYVQGGCADPTGARALSLIAAEAVTSLPELLPEVRAQNEAMLARLQARIDEAVAAGQVRPGLPARPVAVLVLAALRGLVAQHLIEAGDVDVAEAAGLLCALLGEDAA